MRTLFLLAQAETFWLPARGSTIAPRVDFVFAFIFWISLFFFALIVGLMLFFVIRYRRRAGYVPKPAPSGNLAVELVWTGIPILVVAAIFWVGFKAYLAMAVPPENAYEIKVTAQKWAWLFEYPNGWVDGELHVPVDRDILLTLRSEDVIHSFYVPDFRVKMDVVPGRYNKAWFHAPRTGEFTILCTEYCGTGHSDMLSRVIVHEPGGYEKWLAEASDLLSPVFRAQDLTDAASLLDALKRDQVPIRTFVMERLSPATRKMVETWSGGTVPDDLKKALLEDLNAILSGDVIYDPARFAGITVSEDAKKLLETPVSGDARIELNRYLITDAFPDSLARAPDLTEAGRYIYERKGACMSCHTIDGSALVGPSLLGIWGRRHAMRDGEEVVVDENYVRESILDPMAKIVKGYDPAMPTYRGRLSDREIDALIAFLKTLAQPEGERK